MFVCDGEYTNKFLDRLKQDTELKNYVATNELLDAKYGIFFFDVLDTVVKKVEAKYDIKVHVVNMDLHLIRKTFEDIRYGYRELNNI